MMRGGASGVQFAFSNGVVTGIVGPGGATINLAPTYTFATLPAATAYTGLAFVSDIGNGTVWVSDGTVWRPMGGQITLARWSVPVGVPSSGSIGNNGALTLTTALDRTYAGGIYLYFPADAIAAGVAAGFYYCTMSSTTAGTIFNNTNTGIPTIPASPTAFVTTGPGAYTQTTGSDLAAVTYPVAASLLGLNGGLENTHTFVTNNTAGAKSLKHKYSTYAFFDVAATTSTLIMGWAEFVNTSATAQKTVTAANTGIGGTSGAVQAQVIGAINSATLLNYTETIQLAVATDWGVIQGGQLKLNR